MAMHTTRELLERVSRSFALTIPLLDKNKVREVEVQYLLARLLDTIEDSAHSIDVKHAVMEETLTALADEDGPSLARTVATLREKTINDHDKVLLDSISAVTDAYALFDDGAKELALTSLREMGKGMLLYQEKAIETFFDLDDYCYYVAGTVGVYLTRIVALRDGITLSVDDGLAYARFLQKVNIIKDFYPDYKEGRIFWPQSLFTDLRAEDAFTRKGERALRMRALGRMVDSALREAEKTFRYIASVPKEIVGYRRFCLVPALMAWETLSLMRGNDDVFSAKDVKIPRTTTLAIMAKATSGYYTDDRLAALSSV